jgi:hypothetical protein
LEGAALASMTMAAPMSKRAADWASDRGCRRLLAGGSAAWGGLFSREALVWSAIKGVNIL